MANSRGTHCAATIAATAISFYNYRVTHLLAIERLRNRIATDLHDDIGSSLTQITILSELARRNTETDVLTDIGSIARSVVAEMSDIVWAVNPRHDRFEEMLHRMRRFANDVLGGADIDVRFEAANIPAHLNLPLEARRPLYLVFKEAVNNVARHSRASKAMIHLEMQDHLLILAIEDNGRGFDSSKSYPGEGLRSVQRRMREVGGDASWAVPPSGGTLFRASLPVGPRKSLHELMGSVRAIGR